MKINLLNEKLSVSNVVKTYANKIADKIEDEAIFLFKNKKIFYSPITKTCYVTGEFTIDTFEFANDKMPTSLKINFIIYDVKNIKEYNELIYNEQSNFLNSESDYKSLYIRIVSAYINNELITNFYENVYHEVEYIYQYAQGMQKNINLYDEIMQLNNSKNKDEKNVGYSLYFTFKHEQDAMAHQFYALLREYEFNINDFNFYLMKYSEYKNAISCLNNVKLINKAKLQEILKNIGLTISQYNKRIHYSYKRFKQKLYNVFKLSFFELNETHKHLISMYNIGKELIYEDTIKKYDFKPLIKIESIYEI